MVDWLPISALEMDGRQVRFLFSGGDTCEGPALPPVELAKAERVKLVAAGVWADHSRWTVVGWRELRAAANDHGTFH